ncbi:MAG: hypothetical protein AAF354_00560 [Pseudomonadota bacterium]
MTTAKPPVTILLTEGFPFFQYSAETPRLCLMTDLNDSQMMRHRTAETENHRTTGRNRSRPDGLSVPMLLTLALGALVVKASLVATLMQKLSVGLATTVL